MCVSLPPSDAFQKRAFSSTSPLDKLIGCKIGSTSAALRNEKTVRLVVRKAGVKQKVLLVSCYKPPDKQFSGVKMSIPLALQTGAHLLCQSVKIIAFNK